MNKYFTVLFVAALGLSASLNSFAKPENQSEGERSDRGERRSPPVFSVIDLDSDGFVTLEEFSSQPTRRHHDHASIFANIDSNEDGYISESELSSHKPKRPDRQKAER